MRRGIQKVLMATAVSAAPFALAHAQYAGPALPPGANAALQTYCSAGPTGGIVPMYSNPEVLLAAQKLSRVSKNSFYFYNPILAAYALGTFEMGKFGSISKLVKSPMPGVSKEAHAFLVQLCGEFRDRPSLIQAKLRWVGNMFTLPNKPQGAVDYTQNVWSQLSAAGYGPYLRFTDALWFAKQQVAGAAINVGGYAVAPPVMPNTVCETKVIVSEFVAKGLPFSGLAQFNAVANDAVKKGLCTQADLDYYYDFRGDSNFKPQSPESNGMLWWGNAVAGHCATQSRAGDLKVRDADCQTYFSKPFASRWNAARAGLATWVARHGKFDSIFADTKQQVFVSTANMGVGANNKPAVAANMTPWATPFAFMFDGDRWPRSEYHPGGNFAAPDFGLAAMTATGGGVKMLYERLRDAVNRHTDWYKSGWIGTMVRMNRQAYSPFVASSYEMSKSDAFTAPGYTVGSSSGDGRKHWMFVFRVHKSQWYTSRSALAGAPVNFDYHWLDETSLGTVTLAKSERAFDRLGTALEGELDSILYLHNIEKSGAVVGNE